ncbi:MAG: MAPEG family protein [Cardiobacteriaceae bacterium]|nr:MAPEG family protein [Cardiobacteriaceae bacterium]
MHYVHIVALLAVFQFFFFGVLVGMARGKYGIKAPATTGHEMFDRAFRVHANTQEQLLFFLPVLLIANIYWSDFIVALIGVVYLVGRLLFWRAYMIDPDKRELGFILTVIPSILLFVMAIVGALFF